MLSAQDSALLLRRSMVILRFSKSLVETNASRVRPWRVLASISATASLDAIKGLAAYKNNTSIVNCLITKHLHFCIKFVVSVSPRGFYIYISYSFVISRPRRSYMKAPSLAYCLTLESKSTEEPWPASG